MSYPIIILHKGKETSLQRFHPWVFSGAIKLKPDNLIDGEIVSIYSHNNIFLATGFYSNGSIAIRIISFIETEINLNFWIQKINNAYIYRQQLGILNNTTNVCRLFFGEGDGVPGLIIDYYNGHCVLQAHTLGVYLQKQTIVEALKHVLKNNLISVYDKSKETLPKNQSETINNSFLFGALDEELVVKENNYSFAIDFINGQKTGFFIDQRDNRKLLTKYCQSKKVLNTFAYTGGFSVYAAKNAIEVHSVDVSATAIKLANKNVEINKLTNHTSFVADTFDFIKDKKNEYDVIILDPPAFAKNLKSKHNAVIGYKKLNAMALKLIKPNGILFTFSCSGVVDKNLFYNTIISASIEAKRNVKLLHYLYQPPDHPVIPYFPEGEYLKGMVLWVE
ncbi:MAG: class I SAM-dependent rRNA methyltransferase [Bacteroidetes bacterium]|nr:class I SAM-dependent rRNA methyltransferase [Bacteroidota bacterium]